VAWSAKHALMFQRFLQEVTADGNIDNQPLVKSHNRIPLAKSSEGLENHVILMSSASLYGSLCQKDRLQYEAFSPAFPYSTSSNIDPFENPNHRADHHVN